MRKIIAAVLLLSVVSCSKQENKSGTAVVVDMYPSKSDQPNLEPNIKLSDFVDSVKYLRLETTPECVMGRAYKTYFIDDKIVVADLSVASVFIFDSNGKYLRKIARKGRGPQEYIEVGDMLFDYQTKQIIVYCFRTHKMLFYDLNGEFVRKIDDFSGGALIRNIEQLPNGNYLCYTYDVSLDKAAGSATGLWEVDAAGKYIKNHLVYPDVYAPVFNFTTAYIQTNKTAGKVYFRDAIHSDIYQITNDSLVKIIDFNDLNSPLKDYKELDIIPDGKPGYGYASYSHFKGKWMLISWYHQKKEGSSILYDTTSSRMRFAEHVDFEGKLIPASWPTDSNLDNAIIWTALPHEVAQSIVDQTLPEPIKALYGASKEPQHENPILQITYLKN